MHQLLVQLSAVLLLLSSAAVVLLALLVATVDEAVTTLTGDGGASAALRTPGTGTALPGMGYDTMDEKGWAVTGAVPIHISSTNSHIASNTSQRSVHLPVTGDSAIGT